MNNESVLQMQRSPSAGTEELHISAKNQIIIESTPIYENDATNICGVILTTEISADEIQHDHESSINVNFDDIDTFMTLLFGDFTPTLQTFDDVDGRRSKELVRIFYDMKQEHIPTLLDINQKGGGIFAMINEGDCKGRSTENVTRVNAVFSDLDGSPLQPVLDAGLTPHIIVESSLGRYHAYWLIVDCPLDMFRPLQKAIARRFNSDPKVIDLPRVMRIPGFMHNKEEPFLSRILETNDIPRYTVAEIVTGLGLTISEQDAEHKQTPTQKKKASVSAKLIEALNSIDPATLEYDEWRNVGFALHHELGADGQSSFDSWSQTDVARYNLGAINSFWQGIKANQKNPVTVATIFKMAKDRGWSPPPPPIIEELNKKYFVSQENGKTSIYKEDYEPLLNRNVLHRLSFPDFLNFYNNKNIQVGTDSNGETKYAKKGKHWIDHPARRQYEGIVMAPGQTFEKLYNIWRGFSVEPEEGKWELMFMHIKEIICMNDPILFSYVLGWMARAIQIPSKPAEVALVLQGGRGTGKGTLANCLCKLFGQHAVHASHGQHVSGKFNSHMRDCVLLYADEAFWAGDKQGENTLKAMITEPVLGIEGKGKDLISAPNMLHIIMSSNNDWVIPAGIDERRYCVVKVSDKRKGDHAYFDAIEHEMSHGGLEAMLFDLLNYDISDYKFRDVPQTIGLQEQKLQSLDPFHGWWYNKLIEGSLVSTEGSYWGDIPCQVLYEDYAKVCGQVGVRYKSSTTQFGLQLPKVLPDNYPRKYSRMVDKFSYKWFDGTSTRCNHYSFPPLDKARSHFEKLLGCNIKWNDTGTSHADVGVQHLCTTFDE